MQAGWDSTYISFLLELTLLLLNSFPQHSPTRALIV